jgi:hypothetical protein
MEFTKFVRKPFFVEAIEITNENIAEIAPFVGELKEKPNGQPFIHVDKKKVPNVFRVYPGFWMTRMGDQVRVYAERVFKEQFGHTTPEIEEWVSFLREDHAEATPREDDAVAAST